MKLNISGSLFKILYWLTRSSDIVSCEQLITGRPPLRIKRDYISILSALAIIAIILNHANLGHIRFIHTSEIVKIALYLFTVISSFKLVVNHRAELKDNNFLGLYITKRLDRLYRPYIGYTVLMFLPLYFAIRLRDYIPILNSFVGLNFLDSGYLNAVYEFLIGNNSIVHHLWYLSTLLIVTVFFLSCIYFYNMKKYYLIPMLMIFFLGLSYMVKDNRFIEFFIAYSLGALLGCFFEVYNAPIKSLPALTYIGDNSFYIYIFHEPIIEPTLVLLFFKLLNIHSDFNFLVILIVPLVIALSVLTYKTTKLIGLNWLIENTGIL